MRLQDGIVRQAGVPAAPPTPPNRAGRWVAATTALSSALSPLANEAKTVDFLRYRSVSGVGGRTLGTKSNTVVGSAERAESGPASKSADSPASGAKALT